jgi:glutathione S-transferase
MHVLTNSRYAPEKIPYGIKRYQEETRRLFDVVEDGLKAGKGEYLVGDKYSIVDISSESSFLSFLKLSHCHGTSLLLTFMNRC